MSRRTLLAVSLLAIPATAGADRAGQPSTELETDPMSVIGGSTVPPGKWPDSVAVLGPQGSCTGTLIAADVVLTAGHCAQDNPTRIIANTTNYNAPGGTHATIESITAYPSWETTYDVSVIVLTAPIAGIKPRPIGTACTFQGFAANMPVHLVGFGLTDSAGEGDNTLLNEATAPVTDPDCSGGNGCVAAVAPGGEFVAGGDGTDSCFGDSGGPVYLDTARGSVLIGAVSRGLDNSPTPCGGGGIYVRTDKIVKWIESTTGRQVSKDTCIGASPPDNGSGSGDDDTSGDEDRSNGGTDVLGGCAAGGSGAGLGTIVIGLALALRRRRGAQVQG